VLYPKTFLIYIPIFFSDGTQCVPLSPPKNGDFTCSGLDEGKAVAGSKCSVFCKESFLAVEDAVKVITTDCKIKLSVSISAEYLKSSKCFDLFDQQSTNCISGDIWVYFTK